MPTPQRSGRRPTPMAIALLCLVVAGAMTALGVNVYYRGVSSDVQRSDFVCFHLAAQAMLAGGDIYAVTHPRDADWRVFYPPGMPALLAPLGLLSLPAATIAWYVLSAAAFLWSSMRLIRMSDEITGQLTGVVVAAAILANAATTISGLQRGQFSPLLAALCIEALWHYRAGRSAAAGAWIGLAAALKAYPALLLLPMVVRRDVRGVGAFAVVACGLTLGLPPAIMGFDAGADTIRRFFGEILLPILGDPNVASAPALAGLNQLGASNQSLFAFFGRWLARSSIAHTDTFAYALADWPTAIPRAISLAAALLMLGVLGWLSLRIRRRGGIDEALLWSMGMSAACLCSNVAWHHYFTAATPLYALLAVAACFEPARTRRRLLLCVGAAFAANWLYFAGNELVLDRLPRKAGLLTVSVCIAWVAAARLIARHTRRGADAAQGATPSAA